VLFDTFHKHRGNLFDHLPPTALRGSIEILRQAAIPVVLGGSLNPATIAEAVVLQPDYIAVRGAVCGDGRSTALQARLVRQLAAQIRGEKCRLAARASGIPPFA
jgi:uncharacterized protein (UPF0264 family)